MRPSSSRTTGTPACWARWRDATTRTASSQRPTHRTGELAADLDVSPGLPMIQAKAREVYAEAAGRLRLTLDTLERVSASVAGLKGRKTLLLVSEGFIMDPTEPEFRDLRAARRANTAVHFIDARSPEGALGQAGMAGGGAEFGDAVEERDTTTLLAFAARETEGARSVALDTGGSIVSGTAALADEMARIARESRAYYLLGYVPTNTKRDGKFRKIEVAVARPGSIGAGASRILRALGQGQGRETRGNGRPRPRGPCRPRRTLCDRGDSTALHELCLRSGRGHARHPPRGRSRRHRPRTQAT